MSPREYLHTLAKETPLAMFYVGMVMDHRRFQYNWGIIYDNTLPPGIGAVSIRITCNNTILLNKTYCTIQ